MKQNELQHHGVPGMKWGVRRYQNKDGSLTPAGKKRANKLKNEYLKVTGKKLAGRAVSTKGKTSAPKEKSIKDMTDDEIRAKINRINLERTLTSLEPKQVSRGKSFVNKVMKDVITPAATQAGQRILNSWLEKKGKELLGLNQGKQKDPLADLRFENEKSRLTKQTMENNRIIEKWKKEEKEKKQK